MNPNDPQRECVQILCAHTEGDRVEAVWMDKIHPAFQSYHPTLAWGGIRLDVYERENEDASGKVSHSIILDEEKAHQLARVLTGWALQMRREREEAS